MHSSKKGQIGIILDRIARTNYVRRCGLLLLNAYLSLLLETSSGHAHRHRSLCSDYSMRWNDVEGVGEWCRVGFRCGVWPGEWLWVDSNAKMETRHPVEGSFDNEFSSLYNHCGVMTVWSRKIWKILRNFCVSWKNDPLQENFLKFCSERIHRDTDRCVVFKFREIWPTGNR